jgi:hypothetical protein
MPPPESRTGFSLCFDPEPEKSKEDKAEARPVQLHLL